MITFSFIKNDWQHILKTFSKKVHKNKYLPAPYDKYKCLQNFNNVNIRTHSDIEVITIFEGENSISFSTYDNSFGQFLNSYLFSTNKEKGEDKMAECNCSTITSCNSQLVDNLWKYDNKTTTNPPWFKSNLTIDDLSWSGSVAIGKAPVTGYIGIEKNKEEKKNNMKNFNFDFGPCNKDVIRMSMYGLAIKNASGTWVSYDKKAHAIMDVDIFNSDGAKYLYKMPVAMKDIKAGDCIIHAKKPMFVTRVAENSLFAVDPVDGENKEIMLAKSPFGFNFCTKVVNLFENFTGAAGEATEENPFGNMWMLMMMGENDNNMMLPLMMMNSNMDQNTMMMMAMMNSNNDWLIPFMFMNNTKKSS